MDGRIPLLLNPQAGAFHASGLKAWLERHPDDFQLIPTTSAIHLTETAQALAADGVPMVAAAGGDGTLMHTARGLAGSATALGILPSGTMNVFAREVGIGSRRFNAALRAMRRGTTQEVDIFAVNGRPFLQMAGFGPDARIIQLITPKLKKRMGAAAHILTGLKVAAEHRPLITVRLPDGEILQGSQVILGNGKRYAGMGRLFAKAQYDDARLDAAIFHQDDIGILLEVLRSMLQWGATNRNTSALTQIRQFPVCDIWADGRLPWHLDGDYIDTLEPGEIAHIECLPQKLRVCVARKRPIRSPMQRFLARHPNWDALLTRIRNSRRY